MRKTLITIVTALLALVAAPAFATPVTPEPEFVPYHVQAGWLLPESWDYAVTPTPTAAIYPQSVLTGAVPACRWAQVDDYLLESPEEVALYESLDDDGVLTKGEDKAIYATHVFTAGPACEPEPTPEPTPAPTPEPTVTLVPVPTATHPTTVAKAGPPPAELAATGVDGRGVVVACIVLLTGMVLVLMRTLGRRTAMRHARQRR